MSSDPPPLNPPLLTPQVQQKKSAPGLCSIIVLKLVLGVILLFAGVAMYGMRGTNLQEEFRRALSEANISPDSGTFGEVTKQLERITPPVMQTFAIGTVLYGLLSIVQGAGLIFRAAWAGWLVIIESLIFVPVEVWELVTRFSVLVLVVLLLNAAICWYLLARRRTLFPMA
jgi:uncharacterized membrane protein (DUF2068 family)